MSEAYAAMGGILLTIATIPQAWRILRGAPVDEFAWGFILLNVAGIGLLAMRAFEIGERAMLAMNVATLGFWSLVACAKMRVALQRPAAARREAGAGGRI